MTGSCIYLLTWTLLSELSVKLTEDHSLLGFT